MITKSHNGFRLASEITSKATQPAKPRSSTNDAQEVSLWKALSVKDYAHHLHLKYDQYSSCTQNLLLKFTSLWF